MKVHELIANLHQFDDIDDVNVVIVDQFGLHTITNVVGITADPNGDLYVAIEKEDHQ